MRKKKKKRYYALPCMVAIAAVAALLAGGGFVLRRTLLKGLPQYDAAPDIALPMLLLKDSGPLREAQARAEWEAAEAARTSAPTAMPTVAPTAVPTEAPAATPAPTDMPTPSPTEAPTPEPTAEPAPTEVPESYFDHTLFIGDSKTDGLRMWGRLGKARYFCGTNYTVYNVFDKKASDEDFKSASLDSVLSGDTYDQVYILLGYNECGYPYDSLMKQFQYVIARVHSAQPDARVILHGIMHASARTAKKYSYYTVAHIEMMNDGLRQLAEETEGLYYVDCNAPFCDGEGWLLPEVSADGEHLTPDYTAQWAQEIRRQAVTE